MGLSGAWAQAIPFSTVVIDAGHGGKDGGTAWNGLVEKNLCLDTALRLQKVLKAKGIRTVMVRTSDKTVELEDRARLANRYSSSVYVSIHFNASLNKAVSGFETYYRSPRGRVLALSVQRQLDLQLKGINRGVAPAEWKVLKETRMPAILVECGFISNLTESRRCGSAAHRQDLAQAIADGLLRARRG